MIESIGLTRVVQQGDIEITPESREIGSEKSDQSFADMLTDAVNSVDQTMKDSNEKVQNFVAGETENVHDVMISMQRAQLSFQMMVEMRNKAIETYQEISRMQI